MRASVTCSLLVICSILAGCLQTMPQTVAQRQASTFKKAMQDAHLSSLKCREEASASEAYKSVSSWMIISDSDPRASEKKSNKSFLSDEQAESARLLKQLMDKCERGLIDAISFSPRHAKTREAYKKNNDNLAAQLFNKELTIGAYNTKRLVSWTEYANEFESTSQDLGDVFQMSHDREVKQRQQEKTIIEADFDVMARERNGTRAWEEAKITYEKVVLETYIADYPRSTHLSEAKERLEWLNVLDSPTEQALIDFKLKYPDSIFQSEVVSRGESFLAENNTISALDAFSRNWPELTNQINAKRAEIEISKMLETAKTEGTSIKLYQFGLKKQAAGDLDGASRAYNAIVEELSDGDFVVESLEKLVEIKATKDQIKRERKERVQRALDRAEKLNEQVEAIKAEERRQKAAEARKREEERKERQERWDREKAERDAERNKKSEYLEICNREFESLKKRCRNNPDCENSARMNLGTCLDKYGL